MKQQIRHDSSCFKLYGNRLTRIDARGDVTTYAYNNLNRLDTITYADGGTVTFGYDTAGRMTSAANPNGTVTFTLDPRSRVTGTTDVWGQAISYGYDHNNNRTSMTMGASQTTYLYGALDRLSSMTHNTMGATAFGYDSIRRLTYAKNGSNISIIKIQGEWIHVKIGLCIEPKLKIPKDFKLAAGRGTFSCAERNLERCRRFTYEGRKL
ncbi:MAG: RHS repeat protein [Acidobacteria bacterium]|nr:RHS repeat protein [Acidobacteriota bacterium]